MLSPQVIHFNRVFHINHPFWGTTSSDVVAKIKVGVSENRGKTPKMDGENDGNFPIKMDDLGVPLFLETPI